MTGRRAKHTLDPVELELFRNRFASVAEEMGGVLEHTGFSPNINSRRDFSCALFDAEGAMVSHAAHIPVHLGSTPLSVRAAIAKTELRPGDVVMLNDPFSGGTHLPDVTLVAPVYLARNRRPISYVANRAHHADMGGASPGSMPLAREIHEEGFRMPPVRLIAGGRVVDDTVALFLANTRVSSERLGDLDAQLSALARGQQRILDLCDRFGPKAMARSMAALQNYAATMVGDFITTIPSGAWSAVDYLDDDGFGSGPVPIRVRIRRRGRLLEVDFAGSAEQVEGPLNANLAVTTAAVFYVVAALVGREIPANEGMLRPIRISAPEGSVVNCRFPAAVAGGNVETSQRIVDVLLRALARALPGKIPAASCGTMTNLALGGYDPDKARQFSYYETVGGGCGAGPAGPGASAFQTHMTNTLNTPVEVLEAYYPLEVCHYRVRDGSGGRGLHRGGDGIDRELRVLTETTMTLLGERRSLAPYGLAGGEPGARGLDEVISGGKRRRIGGKVELKLCRGDRVRLRTPGGGGWGKQAKRRSQRLSRP